MLANREGLFHAYPVAIGLGETRENRLLQVVILYRLTEELTGDGWVDCSGENMEISGYHYLEKRDHSLNESTIAALKAALGWDGRDPFWLQDNAEALAQQPVQVKLAFEEYDGGRNIKVKFLNPYGAKGSGSVPKADDDMRRNVSNRLGAKFRAQAGGTPANPPKPIGKPVAPAAPAAPAKPAPTPPVPAPAATPAAPTPATMDQAWAEFTSHCTGDKWDQQAVEKEWFRILADLFPGKQPDQLTPADWGRMLAEGPGNIIPF
jgi:hypothetical protein